MSSIRSVDRIKPGYNVTTTMDFIEPPDRTGQKGVPAAKSAGDETVSKAVVFLQPKLS